VSGTDHHGDIALVCADGDADTFRAVAEGKVRVEGMVLCLGRKDEIA
jgi:hypothetical protein